MELKQSSSRSAYTSIIKREPIQITTEMSDLDLSMFKVPKTETKEKFTRFQTKSHTEGKLKLPNIRTSAVEVFPAILKKTKEKMKNYRKEMEAKLNEDQVLTDQTAISILQTQRPQQIFYKKSGYITSIESPTPTLPILLSPNTERTNTDLHQVKSSKVKKFHSVLSRNDSQLQNQIKSVVFGDKWKMTNSVQKVNKAYLIQQDHLNVKMEEQLSSNVVYNYLHQNLILNGTNEKKGLRNIFILLYKLKKQKSDLKNQDQKFNKSLSILEYFIPIYQRIQDQVQIMEDQSNWKEYICELLKIKNKGVQLYYLDGRPVTDYSQVSNYEKVLYLSLGNFDLWDQIKKDHNLLHSFNKSKYNNLTLRLYDAKDKKEIISFFNHREQLQPFFEQQQIQNSQSPQQINIQKILSPTTPFEDREIEERMFESSVFHMDPETQQAFISAVHQNLLKQRSKYSNKLANLEEALRNRLSKIKEQRRHTVRPFGLNRKAAVSLGEQEQYERMFLYGDIDNIDDIKEYALDKVAPTSIVVPKKKAVILNNVDPFELLRLEKGKKQQNILRYVNLEKIMSDKQLSREDVITYLSIFKSLADSEPVEHSGVNLNQDLYQPDDQFDSTPPALQITLKQLRRALPYLALFKPITNTKILNQMFDKKYRCIGFLEFLDIFSPNSVVVSENNEEEDEEQQYV